MIFTQAAALAPLLKPNQRLLGIDLGEKTLGLALSDVERGIATPMKTLPRGKFARDAEALKALTEEHGVGGIVLGMPLNMDGSAGARVQATHAFSQNLARALGLPILLWDERMSTMAVERAMLEADLSRKRRAELVDKLAASYILQGALDSLTALSMG